MKTSNKTKGKDEIKFYSSVCRKLHVENYAVTCKIAKLIKLFEGPLIVMRLYRNVAIIISLYNDNQRQGNVRLLKLFRFTKEKK